MAFIVIDVHQVKYFNSVLPVSFFVYPIRQPQLRQGELCPLRLGPQETVLRRCLLEIMESRATRPRKGCNTDIKFLAQFAIDFPSRKTVTLADVIVGEANYVSLQHRSVLVCKAPGASPAAAYFVRD